MCSAFFPRVAYVRFFLIQLGTACVSRVFSSGGLYAIFAYRTRHTPCVARFFPRRVAYVRFVLKELGTDRV